MLEVEDSSLLVEKEETSGYTPFYDCYNKMAIRLYKAFTSFLGLSIQLSWRISSLCLEHGAMAKLREEMDSTFTAHGMHSSNILKVLQFTTIQK